MNGGTISGTALSMDSTACLWTGGYHEWVTTDNYLIRYNLTTLTKLLTGKSGDLNIRQVLQEKWRTIIMCRFSDTQDYKFIDTGLQGYPNDTKVEKPE